MMGLIIAIHLIICTLLIIIILIQSGRGGGLVEGFSGVESMFGTKTNTFLTRTTTILSILFFLTCISLAYLSAKKSRSLMQSIKPQEQQQQQQQSVKTSPTQAQEKAAQEQGPSSTPAQTQPPQTPSTQESSTKQSTSNQASEAKAGAVAGTATKNENAK